MNECGHPWRDLPERFWKQNGVFRLKRRILKRSTDHSRGALTIKILAVADATGCLVRHLAGLAALQGRAHDLAGVPNLLEGLGFGSGTFLRKLGSFERLPHDATRLTSAIRPQFIPLTGRWPQSSCQRMPYPNLTLQ